LVFYLLNFGGFLANFPFLFKYFTPGSTFICAVFHWPVLSFSLACKIPFSSILHSLAVLIQGPFGIGGYNFGIYTNFPLTLFKIKSGANFIDAFL
jgi:hypothetical protein